MTLDELSELAARAVRRGAELCERVRADLNPATVTKGDRTPVTVADYASQAVIGRMLAETTPEIPLIAEEDADALRRSEHVETLARVTSLVEIFEKDASPESVCRWIDRGRPSTGRNPDRFWTLDPIDGTKGFLRGDHYAVALALIDRGRLEVAAMGCPSLGAVFVAKRGGGSKRVDWNSGESQEIRVSPTTDVSVARFCERIESSGASKDLSALVAEAMGVVAEPRRLDSQAKYAVTALGEVELYLRLPSDATYQEKIWDHAAGALLVEEAGGRVSDVNGEPLDFTLGVALSGNRGVVASNGLLHPALLAAIAKVNSDIQAS